LSRFAAQHGLGVWCLAVCALACHPRTDATPDVEERDPPCLGASITRLHHRVEQGSLLIEREIERICPQPGEAPSRTERLVSLTLGQQRGCPAGQVVLEVAPAKTPRPLLELPGVSSGQLEHVAEALRNFASVHGKGSGLAFVLSCEANPRWLFVTINTPEPMLQEFSEGVPPLPPAQAGSAGVAPQDSQPNVALPDAAPAPTGTCEEALPSGDERWVGRVLSTGAMPGPSRMTRWFLGRTKRNASLVIQELEAIKRVGRSDDQPHGEWRCARSAASEGSVSGSRQLTFSFSKSPGGGPTTLVCAPRLMRIADADARRVRVSSPAPGEGCNASRWSAPPKTELRVLVCAEGDSEEFFLAQGPGVERVLHDEDVLYDEPRCKGTPPALRRVPLDGGVAPAIKVSETPQP